MKDSTSVKGRNTPVLTASIILVEYTQLSIYQSFRYDSSIVDCISGHLAQKGEKRILVRTAGRRRKLKGGTEEINWTN
jgi:hypothetical protein